ncbi:MAG: hypothetical protein PF517_13770, partial [Salinivirgaceae bacterium]|nr:hypothetical protein [Salinivirgaceae bacterium]
GYSKCENQQFLGQPVPYRRSGGLYLSKVPLHFVRIAQLRFNSLAQFNKYYPLTLKADHPISCGLRVNPEQSDVDDSYNTSSPKSRLGV